MKSMKIPAHDICSSSFQPHVNECTVHSEHSVKLIDAQTRVAASVSRCVLMSLHQCVAVMAQLTPVSANSAPPAAANNDASKSNGGENAVSTNLRQTLGKVLIMAFLVFWGYHFHAQN